MKIEAAEEEDYWDEIDDAVYEEKIDNIIDEEVKEEFLD